jgi:hypothetical protein
VKTHVGYTTGHTLGHNVTKTRIHRTNKQLANSIKVVATTKDHATLAATITVATTMAFVINTIHCISHRATTKHKPILSKDNWLFTTHILAQPVECKMT